jgi:regulator of sirC expression with transglutaminase-like and TPR domain
MKDLQRIQALISLMDDPDEQIYEHVRMQLIANGVDALPALELAVEAPIYESLYQERLSEIIREIQLESNKKQLSDWYESPAKDLLKGALIVARFHHPALDEDTIKTIIERIRRDCWLELNPNMTAFESVRVLNKVIFGQYGFSGDTENYNSPQNSYIHQVLQSKKGNPLSLSLIYSIVAQQLELPIYGINLPNHFILAFMDNNGTNLFLSNGNDYGVLFYINAFSKGTIFQIEDIQQFLNSIQLPPNPTYFQPCSNSDIIRRMITNLIAGYQQSGNQQKVEELTELRAILD